ncbi:MAG: hypothetical protein ACRDD7_03495 [Peptostreptococcaceae bacterium]
MREKCRVFAREVQMMSGLVGMELLEKSMDVVQNMYENTDDEQKEMVYQEIIMELEDMIENNAVAFDYVA